MANQNPSGTSTTLGQANPTAYWLSVAGLAIQVVAVVMIAVMYTAFSGLGYGMFGMMGYYGSMMGPYYGGWYGATGVWIIFAAIAIVLGILGVMWMNSSDISRLRNGAVLVLVAAILAFPTMWGFWIGSILMFIGAIMGLTTSQTRV